jgi:hypothetical protein
MMATMISSGHAVRLGRARERGGVAAPEFRALGGAALRDEAPR